MRVMEDKQHIKWKEHNYSGCCDENGLPEENTNKQERKKGTRDITIAKCNQRLVVLWTRITVGTVVEIGIHIY